LFLFDTTTCFGCPHQLLSGKAFVYKNSKRGENFLLVMVVPFTLFANLYSFCKTVPFLVMAEMAETCSVE